MTEEIKFAEGAEKKSGALYRVPVFTFILMLAFAVAAAFFSGSGPYEGFLWLACAAAVTAYTDLISESRLPLLAPIVGAAICAVVCYPFIPIFPIGASFVGYFIASAARGRMARNTSFVLSAATLIAFSVLHFAGQALIEGEPLISGVVSRVAEPYVQMKELFLANGELLTLLGREAAPEDIAAAFRDMLIRSSPAASVIYALITVWVSDVIMKLLSRFFTPALTICSKKASMSIEAAVIFIVAYLTVMLFGSNSSSVIVLACENISMMLVPGFFLFGISSLTELVKAKVNSTSFGIYVTAVIAIFLMSMGVVIMIFAVSGVFFAIHTRLAERKEDQDGSV